MRVYVCVSLLPEHFLPRPMFVALVQVCVCVCVCVHVRVCTCVVCVARMWMALFS